MERNKKITSFLLPVSISLLLFFIPFLWFRPGEVDLGGDSSRLYFYDPLSYMMSHSLWGVSSSGTGIENISYYGLPFMVTLIILKALLRSPTILTAAFHGMSLAVAFLSVYGIVNTLASEVKISSTKLTTQLAASLAGLLYVFSPGLTESWQNVILTHNQFFLNPLLFYLLLRFVISNKFLNLLFAVLLTFIFSPNFSYGAAPPIFAFYPFSLLFLFLYSLFVIKKRFSLKKVFIAILLFILIQSFHLLPQINFILDPTSAGNQMIFSAESKFTRGLQYFESISQTIKTSNNFFLLQQSQRSGPIDFLFVVIPLIVLTAFVFNKHKTYLLVGFFFLLTLFFASANITSIGFEIYKKLFSIPGFSMFRNYYGQWSFAFSFYYALLFGLAVEIVLPKLRRVYYAPIAFLIAGILIVSSYQFINGELINNTLWKTKDKRVFVTMDPRLDSALSYVKSLPIDGKFLTFPMTDPGYQMVQGLNGGIYQGPSLLAYIAGRKDFPGPDVLDPYGSAFLDAAKNNDFEQIDTILSLMNIKYIFYNADPGIYDAIPAFPYERVREYLPKKQAGYKPFIEKITSNNLKKIGNNYYVYGINNQEYLPTIYATGGTILSNDPPTAALFLHPKDKRISITNLQQTNNTDQDIFFSLTNDSPFDYLKNNYHLHTHSPFLSKSPLSILYPLVVIKEDNDLHDAKADLEDYVTTGLFLGTKRIAELELFGSDMLVQNENTERPKLGRIGNYYYWETSFNRYNTLMMLLIDTVQNADLSEGSKERYKIIINEQLIKHKQTLLNAIANSTKTSDEKSYLLQKSIKLFDTLFTKVNVKIQDPNKIPYIIDSETFPQGQYYAYIKSKIDEKVSSVALQYHNTLFEPSQTTGEYLIYGPINIVKGDRTIYLISSTAGSVDSGDQKNEDPFTINNHTNAVLEGIVREIKDWQHDEQYVITFDYRTTNDDLLFKLYEKIQDKNNKYTIKSDFEKLLHSDSWKTHQSIITADPNSINGYMQFLSNTNNEQGEISIRNLSVKRIISPNIFLRKSNRDFVSNANLPKITFQKINPTKYTIQIKNFDKRFQLIFLDAFSNKWKLYEERNKRNFPVIANYFNGDVQEAASKNIFFDNGLVSLTKNNFIAENNHFVANGYANGWVLDPKDFASKKEIDLTLEFTTQRIFYLGLIISVITALFVIISLIYLLLVDEIFKTRSRK